MWSHKETLFDDLFSSVPSAPPAPVVTATAFDDQVLLDWSGLEGVAATESSNISGYAFQGYNVYQLPSATATKSEAVRIGTFDVNDGVQTIYGNVFIPEYGTTVNIPVQYGLDKGVKRQIIVSEDWLTGGPLYVGSEYYFAVTAYNYNAAPDLIEDKALESAAAVQAVVVQPPPPGTRFESPAGTGIVFTKSGGVSDGQIDGVVVDPDKVTGDTYTVGFATSVDTNWTEPIWYLSLIHI